jgi:hypothetical protein
MTRHLFQRSHKVANSDSQESDSWEPMLDASLLIATDMPCLTCGYNLRMQPLDGRCPECGTGVGQSAHGDTLALCDPEWVSRLASGMAPLMVYPFVVLLGMCLWWPAIVDPAVAESTSATEAYWVDGGIALFGNLVALVGFWRLTTPEAGRCLRQPQDGVRKVARYGLLVQSLLIVVGAGLEASTPRLGAVAWLVSRLAYLVAAASLMIHVRWLALRIPKRRLAAWTLVLTILFLLLRVPRLGLCCAALIMHGSAIYSLAVPWVLEIPDPMLRSATPYLLMVELVGGLALLVLAFSLIMCYRGAFDQAAIDTLTVRIPAEGGQSQRPDGSA